MNTWGTTVNKPAGKARDKAYLDFNNSEIKYFAPLEGSYNVQILSIGDWADPFQMWENKNSPNGTFEGIYFSRQAGYNGKCPFKEANDKQLAMNNGRAIENKDREYPISCKYWFLIKVDEIPELPYLLYGVSEKAMNAITSVFKAVNSNPLQSKIIVTRIGQGLNTSYTYLNSSSPVQPFLGQLPAIDKNNYKSFFIGLQSIDHIFGNDGFETQQAETAQATSSFNMESASPRIEPAFEPATPHQAAAMPSGSENPGDFPVPFGQHAGSKLKDIDLDFVKAFAENMSGKLQEKSAEFLNLIGA